MRELSEETGIPSADVIRDKSFNPIKTRGLTMFVVRVKRWESYLAWKTPLSPETVGASWVSLNKLRQIFLPRAMKDVVGQLAHLISQRKRLTL